MKNKDNAFNFKKIDSGRGFLKSKTPEIGGEMFKGKAAFTASSRHGLSVGLINRKALVILLLLLFSVAVAFAENPNRPQLSFHAEPAVQKIAYEEDIYTDRITNGVAFAASCKYTFENLSTFGLELSVGMYPYEGFYSYTDFRVSGAMSWRLIDKQVSDAIGFNVHANFNVGMSMDVRDDSDIGFYPFFQLGPGVAMTVNDISTILDLYLSASFQNGSTVLQLSPRVGLSLPLGRR